MQRPDLTAIAHHLIAHPLLVLCPPVGAWLHDVTTPILDTYLDDDLFRSCPPPVLGFGANHPHGGRL